MNPIVWCGLNHAATAFFYPNPGGGTPSADQTLVGPITGQSLIWRYGVDEDYDPDALTARPLHIFLHGQASSEDAFFTSVWPQVLVAFADFQSNPATGLENGVWVSLRAQDSWYTNNAASEISYSEPGAWPIETMIIDELIPHLENHFVLNGVIFVHGFSMGGFGAGKLSLKHRDVFRGASLWQPPRVNSVVANWPVNFPTEFASIFSSSNTKVDLNTWQQICDVQRAVIISEAYPMYCMKGSGDPGLVAFNNAIVAVQGFGITLEVATAITTAHNLSQMADDGFAPLAIWLQDRITP